MARSSALRRAGLAHAVALSLLTVACSNASSTSTTTTTEPTPAPAPPAPVATVKIERELATARESSAVVLGRLATGASETHAFVADEDDGAIVEIDLAKSSVVHASTLGGRVRDLLVLPDGRIAATLPDHASIAILEREEATGALREAGRVPTPSEPIAMALSPDDSTLYLTTGSSHALVAFAIRPGAAPLEERARHSLGREPRAVLVTSDNARVMVTHAAESYVSILPALAGDGATDATKVETRDIGNKTMCGGHSCSGARTARGASSIVRVGERGIVVPAAQSLPSPGFGFTKSYLCPPSLLREDTSSARAARDRLTRVARGEVTGYGIGTGELGPPVTFDLETIDGKDGSLYGVGTSSPAGPSCLQPRAAAAAGSIVLVACLGSSRINRYRAKTGFDLSASTPMKREWYGDGAVVNVTMDPVTVPSGPSGIAVERDGEHAVVWSSFARKLTRIDVAARPQKADPPIVTIDVARTIPRDAAWLAGREIFFTNGDRRIAVDGRACANCHIDGRDDGLTWKTPMGLRRTRMLAGQTAAGPFGWTGASVKLSDHIKTTIKNLEGAGLPDAEMDQLTAYVSSLAKMPAPVATGSDALKDPAIAHGREVFTAAECSTCHSTGTSDRMVHDVGTGGGYLTPTLAGVATRSDLMHDGRFHSLDQLIAKSTSMGRGSSLSPEDRQALVKYLETL